MRNDRAEASPTEEPLVEVKAIGPHAALIADLAIFSVKAQSPDHNIA